jgi:hypothetical protein
LNWGDSHLNHANSTLPGDAIGAMTGKTRSTFLVARPLDKDLHLASRIARLLFGAATLKNAQQRRDSVSLTVPRKVLHSRASDSLIHPLDHAAAVEEAR